MKFTITILCSCILLGNASAQPAAAPAFDAASIKLNPEGPGHSGWHTRTASVDIRNQSLRDLMKIAYKLKDYQVAGGPAWTANERYDILARALGPANDAEMMVMLQSLLAERFHLVFHRETKQFPGYALVVAK